MVCFSLSLAISAIIALHLKYCICDNNITTSVNSSQTSTSGHNRTELAISSSFAHIQLTEGFLLRSLFVVMVISMAVSLLCIVRAFARRRRHSKRSKEWSTKPKYDTLPTAAINDSLPKSAFVLNDSEEEETLFDASHRLIK